MPPQPPEIGDHPGVNSNHISYYVVGRLKAGTINLYSAYLLMHEALWFDRICCTLPAWQETVGISHLLRVALDYLFAVALKCEAEASESAGWFTAAIPLLQEHRPHFLVDRLSQGRALLDDRSFQQLLSDLRRDYDRLSDDDGPFPSEVFPYDFAAPEREVLAPGSELAFQGPREMDAESSDIYVQLLIART